MSYNLVVLSLLVAAPAINPVPAVSVSAFALNNAPYSQDATPGSPSPEAVAGTATAYIDNAALSDMFEIQSSQIALQKAQSADLRTFARQMIADHTMTTSQLKAAASRSGLTVNPPARLDQRRQGMVDTLQAAPPVDFDGLYLKQQILAHQEALALHSRFAQSGDSIPLKQAAAMIVPNIQHHLTMAEQLGGSAASNSSAMAPPGKP